MRRARGSILCAWVLAAVMAATAQAHDARPVSISIAQQTPTTFAVHIHVPPTLPMENRVSVKWPSDCVVLHDDARDLDNDGMETLVVRCQGGLEGATLKVAYAVYNPALPSLFRFSELNGQTLTQVLPPESLSWTVPRIPNAAQVAASYLLLGVRHIWTGIDHLLFVAGLLVLAGAWRRVVLVITGFTLAHSVTLALCALNLVVLPEPPVEAAIALSILVLAYEILRADGAGLTARYPILVASSFGLLHGFGFAAALREVGLPRQELLVGLFCFNCGVEAGQLAFVCVLLLGGLLVRRVLALSNFASLRSLVVDHRRVVSGYGLGIPAAFWFIQRLSAF